MRKIIKICEGCGVKNLNTDEFCLACGSKFVICAVEGCNQSPYSESVCFFHYILREAWGYGGGYEIYMTEGIEAGRKAFMEWYNKLPLQEAIDMFTSYDYHLEAGIHDITG